MAQPTLSSTWSTSSGNAVSRTIAHTHGDGDLFVVILAETANTVTSVTWNGTAMTQIHLTSHPTYTAQRVYVYRLTSAASGSFNVVATFGTNWVCGVGVFSASGVDSVGSIGSATGNSTSASATATATADTVLVGLVCYKLFDQTTTLTMSDTERMNLTFLTYGKFGGAVKADGSGSTSMTGTLTESAPWVAVVIPINGAAKFRDYFITG